MQMFDKIRNIRYMLVLFAILIAIGSLVTSNYLITDLEEEERTRMEVWAEAMRSLNAADENTDMLIPLQKSRDKDGSDMTCSTCYKPQLLHFYAPP